MEQGERVLWGHTPGQGHGRRRGMAKNQAVTQGHTLWLVGSRQRSWGRRCAAPGGKSVARFPGGPPAVEKRRAPGQCMPAGRGWARCRYERGPRGRGVLQKAVAIRQKVWHARRGVGFRALRARRGGATAARSVRCEGASAGVLEQRVVTPFYLGCQQGLGRQLAGRVGLPAPGPLQAGCLTCAAGPAAPLTAPAAGAPHGQQFGRLRLQQHRARNTQQE